MLPTLGALTLNPRSTLRSGPDVPSGVYCLDTIEKIDPCKSSIVLQRSALPATPLEFEEVVDFMTRRVRQEQFMGNLVPRKQCTFGTVQYKNYQLVSSEWPSLVSRVLEATRSFAAQLGIPDPGAYDGVHANFYADGDASVQKHADDEMQLIEGAPIFSYTYLPMDNKLLARDFSIWRQSKGAEHIEGRGRLVDVTLYSGDLLVMTGDMQKFFHHSIEKQSRAVAPRINLTVRKFISKKDAMARRKALP